MPRPPQAGIRVRVATFVTAVAVLGACSDQSPDLTIPDSPSTLQSQAGKSLQPPGLAQARPGEAAFRIIAREIPAFGGFYLNDNGQLVVQITDLSRSQAARSAVGRFISELARKRNRVGGRPPEVVFQKAQYSFLQLSAWRAEIIDPVLALDGVVLIDVDEKRNRLTVGIVAESDRPEAAAKLAELGVPLEAVWLRVVGQPEPLTSRARTSTNFVSLTGCYNLRQSCRPLIGGYQTQFRDGGQTYNCTVTAPAFWNGDLVLLTAAHCSEYQWDLDGEIFYQPTPYIQVAVEVHDPQGSSCGFLSPYKCRMSDALLATVSSTVEADVGYIARTTGVGNFSTTVSSTNPRFAISSASDTYVGETIYMIGRTTGWRTGEVTETCVSYETANWHRMECTDVTDHNPEGGDSGGPTFLWDGVSDNVTLVGLTFARVAFYDHTFFSPISSIEDDLGSLELRAPEFRGSGGGGGGGGNGCPGGPGCEIMQ